MNLNAIVLNYIYNRQNGTSVLKRRYTTKYGFLLLFSNENVLSVFATRIYLGGTTIVVHRQFQYHAQNQSIAWDDKAN